MHTLYTALHLQAKHALSLSIAFLIFLLTKTITVIRLLHELFTRFEVPDPIVLDNATQFTSKEYKEFCKMFVVEHITTLEAMVKQNGSWIPSRRL